MVRGQSGAEAERFGVKPVRNRTSLGGKWCGSGGVADGRGEESEGFGAAEEKVWATGAKPSGSVEKRCGTGAV